LAQDNEIRGKTFRGLGWTGLSQSLQQGMQFAFTAVLARLLVPHDFGLIALITVFTGFAAVFVDVGFTAALIQRPDLEDRHKSTALWLNLGGGLLLTAVMMAIAPAIASFYGEPRLLGLTLGLAPTFVLSGLSIVQVAMLQREMDFRRLAFVENTTLIGANTLGVVLAVLGFGVWSLVALILASTGLRTGMVWLLSSWRPHGWVNRRAISDLWGFSSRVAGFNAVNYWARNADNLLIGRFVGTNPLAYYNRAYNLMLLPVGIVANVTSRVMFPALSRMQDDHEHIRRVYVRAAGLIALVTFPAIVGLFVVARPFILTVYGNQWKAVIPILQILCVASLIQSVTRTTGWLFTSQGQGESYFRLGLFSTATAIGAFFAGLPWGVKGVATAYVIWTAANSYLALVMASRLVELPANDVIFACSGVFGAATIMGVVVWLVERATPDTWSAPAQLGIGVAAGAVTYLAALHAMSPSPYRDLRELLREFQRRRSSLGVATG
jgi:O-antigen/teichoic acid export membrane protein